MPSVQGRSADFARLSAGSGPGSGGGESNVARTIDRVASIVGDEKDGQWALKGGKVPASSCLWRSRGRPQGRRDEAGEMPGTLNLAGGFHGSGCRSEA